MSLDAHAEHGPGHLTTHGDGADNGSASLGHGTLRGYLIGFGLSVVLTAIPFWFVMSGVLDNKQATALAIMALAVAQILVHMVFFLHMNPRSEAGWSMMALLFTLVLVVIALSGSLWIMFHLTANMMPSAGDMSRMP